MKNLCLIRLFIVLFSAVSFYHAGSQDGKDNGTMTGNDGKTYKTVKIGNQEWIAENLRETKYRDGSAIPVFTDNNQWAQLTTGAWCIYDNDESNAANYGYLYNWPAVADKRNIAPEGWRVPTDEDWKALEMHLGMNRAEADKERYRGSPVGSRLAGNASLWKSGALTKHTEFETSGFSALPAGIRSSRNGTFATLGYSACFWSATVGNTHSAWSWSRILNSSSSDVTRSRSVKQLGLSVRLVRD